MCKIIYYKKWFQNDSYMHATAALKLQELFAPDQIYAVLSVHVYLELCIEDVHMHADRIVDSPGWLITNLAKLSTEKYNSNHFVL